MKATRSCELIYAPDKGSSIYDIHTEIKVFDTPLSSWAWTSVDVHIPST